MPTLVTHSPQELTALCGQLSENKRQKAYQYLYELLKLPDTEQIDETQRQTIFDLCKNDNPALGDTDLEITPRHLQQSRQDTEL